MTRAPADRSLLVAVNLPLKVGDVAFTYAAGGAVRARRGSGVVVPFGRRLLPGIVLGEGVPRSDAKPVLAAVPGEALVPAAVLDRAEWLAAEYLSSTGEAIAATTPWDALWAGLRLRVDGPVPTDLPPEVTAILATIKRRPAGLNAAWRLLSKEDALEVVGNSGTLTAALPATPPAPPLTDPPVRPPHGERRQTARRRTVATLSSQLDGVVAEALDGGGRGVLLAGWERSPAYVAAIRRALAAGWSCVAAFASVAAATAFAAFARSTGLAPAVLHADMPPAQRLATWRALIDRPRMLVVGTRAAVFAPVRDPVIAIVDDEDSSGHKEERAPRYVTTVAAGERTRRQGVLMIGAATPTVATYSAIDAGRLRLIALPSPRPRFGIVDLRRRPDREAPVSRPVADAARRTARQRTRLIVLVDRKGYAGGLHCQECGAVERCPRCAVTMRYERTGRLLRCAICGTTLPAPGVCSSCGAPQLSLLGAGTERVAAALRRLTPAVSQFDRDVVAPGEGADLLRSFRRRGGVLVATQVVLPHIQALRPVQVAVVHADRMLHRPEFRAAERALATLRTIGMASGSTVLVETADPEHPALRAALAPSLKPFYADELALRRSLGYPPARSLIAVTVSARSAALVEAASAQLRAASSPTLEVLGPTVRADGRPPVPRGGRGRGARQEFVIKTTQRADARALLLPLLTGAGRGVDVRVDVDPHEL